MAGEESSAAPVGAQLRAAREQRGLLVEDVSASTRIRAGLVRAIEADQFGACGGAVYARGHIRAIAHVLDVDPVPLVAAFNQASGTAPPTPLVAPLERRPSRREPAPRPAPAPRTQSTPAESMRAESSREQSMRVESMRAESTRAPATPRTPAAPSADGGRAEPRPQAGLGPTRVSSTPQPRPTPGQQRQAPMTLPSVIARPRRRPSWALAAGIALIIVIAIAAVNLIGNNSSGGKHSAATVSTQKSHHHPAPAPTKTSTSAPKGVTAAAGVNVLVKVVSQPCWMSVANQDGQVLFTGLLQPGASHSFHALQSLSFDVGNAGAFQATVNGRPVGSLGPFGKVINPKFSATGANEA